jgi:hypothetical protein
MPWVTMPQLGEIVADGTIGRWLRQPGDRIARGEALVEVITEKVNAEVPSEYDGVLERILAPEGAAVAPASPIAFVLQEGEVAPEGAAVPPFVALPGRTAGSSPPGALPTAPRTPANRTSGAADLPAAAAATRSVSAAAAALAEAPGHDPADKSRGRVTPPVLQLAREAGVNLADVRGTGPGGRIPREDVTSYLVRRRLAGAAPTAPRVPSDAAKYTESAPAPGVARTAPGAAGLRTTAGAGAAAGRGAALALEVDLSAVLRLVELAGPTYRRQEGIPLLMVAFVCAAVAENLGRRGRSDPAAPAAGLDFEVHGGPVRGPKPGSAARAEPVVIRGADRLSVHGLNRALHEPASAREQASTGVPASGPAPAAAVIALGEDGPTLGLAHLPVPGIVAFTIGPPVRRPVATSVDGHDAITVRPIAWLSVSFNETLDWAEGEQLLGDVRRWLESVGEHTPIR